MSTYSTDNLPFAAFLHSTKRLRFLRCEPVNHRRVAFLFDDPQGDGEQLQIAFEGGAECPAATFYDSIRHLRRVMDGTRNKEQTREYTP